jgi:hypothetical protein
MVYLRQWAFECVQVKEAEEQNLETIAHGMRAAAQAGAVADQFDEVDEQQEAACQFEQLVEGVWHGDGQAGDYQ